MHIHVIVK